MKKIIIKSLAALSITLISHVAAADFYLSAGAYATSSDFSVATGSGEDDSALSLVVGWEPPVIPFISVEVAYHDLGSYAPLGIGSEIDVAAYSAQGVFAFPIIPLIFDIYAKLGVAQTDFDVDDSTDPYYAVGIALTTIPVVDFYVEAQRFDFGDNSNSINSYGAGIKVNF